MSKNRNAKSALGKAFDVEPVTLGELEPVTLAELMAALERNTGLAPTRLRDLRSAVKTGGGSAKPGARRGSARPA